MGNHVWSTLCIIVGAEPLQVHRGNGRLQYAALLVSRRGGALSYTPGYFESAQRLPDVTEPRILGDQMGFAAYPHIQPGALEHYYKLFQAARDHETAHKTEAERLNVEEFREQGRRQTKNPTPRRNQQRKAG